ncbi:hypothetical protein [Pseudomonas sp. dw_612]|uniref:hypothetical protein n=1 Tax=Pseudomonas sp. dw_612 TaxID=2720080 RepID=UPI001BD63E3C|nr:hypothetical protein [Pseudomonas sp. dw_612]
MPLPSSIADLSTTAGSNSPAGSESPSLIDDYLRTYASYIALLRDQTASAPQTIASAATTDIGAAVSNVIFVSGTSTITALGTAAAGVTRTVRFLGILVLTHNATSLILPTSANITTAANDTAEFLSLGGGNWLCLRYNPLTGKMVANPLGTVSQVAGIPTGALIERGTNANGEYVRFADGTLICTYIAGGSGATAAAGNGWNGTPATWTFPSPFVAAEIPTVLGMPLNGAGFIGLSGTPGNTSAAWQRVALFSDPTLRSSRLFAMGRWFL